MPCNGIAVLSTTLEQDASIAQAREAFDQIPKTVVKRAITQRDGTRLIEIVFDPRVVNMSVKVAVKPDGSVVAITGSGTFEGGVEVLEKMVAAIAQKGGKVGAKKFETHNHAPNAPQLSYGTPHTHHHHH